MSSLRSRRDSFIKLHPTVPPVSRCLFERDGFWVGGSGAASGPETLWVSGDSAGILPFPEVPSLAQLQTFSKRCDSVLFVERSQPSSKLFWVQLPPPAYGRQKSKPKNKKREKNEALAKRLT